MPASIAPADSCASVGDRCFQDSQRSTEASSKEGLAPILARLLGQLGWRRVAPLLQEEGVDRLVRRLVHGWSTSSVVDPVTPPGSVGLGGSAGGLDPWHRAAGAGAPGRHGPD